MGLRVNQTFAATAANDFCTPFTAQTGMIMVAVSCNASNPMVIQIRGGDATDSPWRQMVDKSFGHTTSGIYTASVVASVNVIPGAVYRAGIAAGYTSGTATVHIMG